ncbi:hypothetical protein [Actinoplanes xinjiangensis]|uniref:hypothetical protein n=1 Tax=Actinoplanes xinjiangensis TaxID=512350 RepID=UPI00343A551C
MRRISIALATAAALAAGLGFVAVSVDRPIDEPTGSASTVTSSASPVRATMPAFDLTPAAPAPTATVRAWPPTGIRPDAVPVGDVLPADGVVIMKGSTGTTMQLSIAWTEDPAYFPTDTPGHRAVLVLVQVENVGSVPFLNDVADRAWLIDTDGNEHRVDADMTTRWEPYAPSFLDASASCLRHVLFEVAEGVEPTRFRLTMRPAGVAQTQEWEITRPAGA